jgi:predicted cobalt transporter CbtA
MLTSLRRGALSGLLAGVLSAAFGYLLAEPLMDRAVGLEAARAKAAGDVGVETFSRSTQHFGFVGAAIVVGIALGVLYGVLSQLLPKAADPWRRALQLGAGAFFALSLVPFLRYPSNPPGVGDTATIDTRSHLWEVSLVIGIVGVISAAQVASGLAGARASRRQLAVVGVLVATIALTFVLPGNTDPVNAPVTLVWEFRLLSIASLALLWGALSVTFGLLAERTSAVTRPLAVPR